MALRALPGHGAHTATDTPPSAPSARLLQVPEERGNFDNDLFSYYILNSE